MAAPTTLGELRQHAVRARSVKEEIRENLVRKLQSGTPLFPGIIGYDETVVPQLVNAILSRHNFILLGLRGQAKSRILRALVELLDETIPVVPGCEIPPTAVPGCVDWVSWPLTKKLPSSCSSNGPPSDPAIAPPPVASSKAAAAARQFPSMQIMSKLPRQMTEDRRSGLVARHLAARLA